MSKEEMEAVREASFGVRYRKIRKALNEQGSEETKEEFRKMEDALLFLVTYIITNQDKNGWWNFGNPYNKVLTAHAMRHLHMIGLTLKSRWNLHGRTFKTGNLLHTTEQLLACFHEPGFRHSYWEEDIWDDCWILLALLEVRLEFEDDEIQKLRPDLNDEFEKKYRITVEWLQRQFDKNGFNKQVQDAVWYGPAHYAAAIELFDHPKVKEDFPRAKENIGVLTSAVRLMLEERPRPHKWDKLFAWHIGQLLVTWKEKRRDCPPLKSLDALMHDLFKELKSRQDVNHGFWGDEVSKETEKVYNTVRALAACYVNTKDKALPNCSSVKQAHKYLLSVSRNNSGPIEDVKGSINTLEALQKLFGFRVRHIFPNVLLTLATQLDRYGITDIVLGPRESDSDTLEGIRASARRRLEGQGKSGLEMLGVNDQLFQSLKGKREFLKEFTGDRKKTPSETDRILSELTRFLSATLTETRSKSSRRLITALWQRYGFLNFIPLIEHLSKLEQDGAFYKYYRDHLNHEVLLFLLGAYIYYNCAAFRTPVNDEMSKIYEEKQIRLDAGALPAEFLFRWKLISTFHDIGYLFEVDPVEDKSRTKEELLAKSFTVVDKFREKFLFDYFKQYIKAKPKPGLTAEQVETEREKEVRALAEEVGKGLSNYDGVIKGKEDLLKLSTPKGEYREAFKLVSRYVKPPYIKQNLIEDYFNLCDMSSVSKVDDGKEIKRDAFLDHGIMSALVLLKAADIQRHYVKELVNMEFSGTLLDNYPQLREILEREDTKAHVSGEQFFIRFSHVAGAIALHNISPHLYTKEQCAEFDKEKGTGLEKAFHQPIGEPGRYLISLDENPLSYLTALADTLQDWDRHSFRRLSFAEESADPLSSSEVIIDFGEDNKINVRPLTNQANEKYGSMTKPEAMDQYLKDWRKYVTIRK